MSFSLFLLVYNTWIAPPPTTEQYISGLKAFKVAFLEQHVGDKKCFFSNFVSIMHFLAIQRPFTGFKDTKLLTIILQWLFVYFIFHFLSISVCVCVGLSVFLSVSMCIYGLSTLSIVSLSWTVCPCKVMYRKYRN